jgi:hypothetical protein
LISIKLFLALSPGCRKGCPADAALATGTSPRKPTVSKQAIRIDASKFRVLMRTPQTAAHVGMSVSPLAMLCAGTDHGVTKSPDGKGK